MVKVPLFAAAAPEIAICSPTAKPSDAQLTPSPRVIESPVNALSPLLLLRTETPAFVPADTVFACTRVSVVAVTPAIVNVPLLPPVAPLTVIDCPFENPSVIQFPAARTIVSPPANRANVMVPVTAVFAKVSVVPLTAVRAKVMLAVELDRTT